MTPSALFSVRMRATSCGSHLSGAERIVPGSLLTGTVADLVDRAQRKGVAPEGIIVTVEALNGAQIVTSRALDLTDHHGCDLARCRALASDALDRAGVSRTAIASALEALEEGPAPSGGNMRGAMIVDACSGERLEHDRQRGIRASRFDWSETAGKMIRDALAGIGLTHFRTFEALALATKVSGAPGIVAELCWSDEPDYTAGYVAAPAVGYLRFPVLKGPGVTTGGRAFFVDTRNWSYQLFRTYLEEVPMLIETIGTVCSLADAEGP